MIRFFDLGRQYAFLRPELLEATDKVLATGKLMGGENATKLENWLAIRTKTKYAIVLHSGTQALEALARYVDYLNNTRPYSIRVPAITFRATLTGMCRGDNAHRSITVGDVDHDGILQSTNSGPGQYSCYVGLYGAAPARLMDSDHDLVDGAQHWLVANGNVGLGMAISFDPTKNLNASGNGGAIVTNNYDLYQFALSFRSNQYDHFGSGTNSRMSELECAHVLVRAQYIDSWQKRRHVIRDQYLQGLATKYDCIGGKHGADTHTAHKFVMRVNDPAGFIQYMQSKSVEVRRHYEYTISSMVGGQNTPQADRLASTVVSLPIYPELTDPEVEYIVSAAAGAPAGFWTIQC